MYIEGDGTVLDDIDPELAGRIAHAMGQKFAAYRTATESMPSATRKHYAKAAGGIIELALGEEAHVG